MAESYNAPDWPQCPAQLQCIRDQPQREGGKQPKFYRLQPMVWHSQAKAGTTLIIDIIGLHRHLPEGFNRCAPAFYCPNIIIKIEELLHRQPGPDSVEYSADMARSIRHILGLLGPSALYCNLVNTMRRGAPLFSLSMALEEAFKAWANSNSHHLSSSEWRLVRTLPMTLSQD